MKDRKEEQELEKHHLQIHKEMCLASHLGRI